MTNQERTEEDFAWVRRAYLETPTASPASVETVQMAAGDTVSSLAAEASPRWSTSRWRRSGLGARSLWTGWIPAATVLAAAGVAIVLWLGERGDVSLGRH